jgi:DNA-binding transcriptional LysR family regulator
MSRATIAQLEAFYWVAELKSVHQAVVRLNLTQPTVSLRLRALQAGLSTPVLEAHGRGLRLTRAGHAYLRKTKLVLDAHAELGQTASRRPITGVLRIGLAEGFAVACLPHLVPAFAERWPRLQPEWTVTTSAALEAGVLNATLDVAVLVDPIGDPKLGLIPLGSQCNVWAGSPALASRAAASAADMAKMTVISTPPPTSMHRNTMAWFARLGQMPRPLCLCTSVNAAAQLAAAGIGIGIFPERMIEASCVQGTITPIALSSPLPPGHVFIAHRAGTEPDRVDAAATLINQVTRRLDYFDQPG